MDGNNHCIRIDANNIVTYAFSDAFETPISTDILVESNAGRHYNPVLTDSQGNFIYKWDGTQLVTRNQDADYLLTVAKQNKLAELQSKCNAALATFQSSALGTLHTYLSGTADMILLNGEYSFVSGPDYDNLPIIWYTVENGNVSHNKAQFVQVYLDGRKHVADSKYKFASLEAQVGAATTVSQVSAILW